MQGCLDKERTKKGQGPSKKGQGPSGVNQELNKKQAEGFSPVEKRQPPISFESLDQKKAKPGEIVTASLSNEASKFIDKYGPTALHAAASNGHTEVVQHLLAQEGVNVNVPVDTGPNGGWTALHAAAANGHTEVVQHLLAQEGVNANMSMTTGPNEGWTALHFAATNGHKDLVEILLTKDDVDANKPIGTGPNEGGTALHAAASNGHTEVVQCLLAKQGVNVNVPVGTGPYEGWTALHFAASRGHAKVVECFLEKNFDIHSISLLDVQKISHPNCIQLLATAQNNRMDFVKKINSLNTSEAVLKLIKSEQNMSLLQQKNILQKYLDCYISFSIDPVVTKTVPIVTFRKTQLLQTVLISISCECVANLARADNSNLGEI